MNLGHGFDLMIHQLIVQHAFQLVNTPKFISKLWTWDTWVINYSKPLQMSLHQ